MNKRLNCSVTYQLILIGSFALAVISWILKNNQPANNFFSVQQMLSVRKNEPLTSSKGVDVISITDELCSY